MASRVLLILFLISASTPAASATEEFRGFWVCPWEMNTPGQVDEVVAFAQSHNFNAVLFECRYRGDALYVPNKVDRRFPNPEPRSPHIGGQPASFDPLGELVTKGHAAGLQVHAWVTTFVVANKGTPTPPGQPFVAHPDWLSRNAAGDVWDPYGMAWLDPALPEVQDYLAAVFLDIVANYDVDGLHLDYVRYTSPAFGRNARALELFKTETGTAAADDETAFATWRRGRIGAFVSRLYGDIAALKPACRLTAAVFASRRGTAYDDCLQDWTAWLAGGYVDAVVPMAYGRDAAVVGKQIGDAVTVAAGRHVYAGLMVPEVKDDDFGEAVGAEMVAKAAAARRAGAQGIIVFSYKGMIKKDDLVARALAADTFVAAVTPPAMAWKAPVATAHLPIVAVKAGDGARYAVVVKEGVPRRYAYLLAKEISARTAAKAAINDAGSKRYRVYAGAYDDRGGAEDLRERLLNLGY